MNYLFEKLIRKSPCLSKANLFFIFILLFSLQTWANVNQHSIKITGSVVDSQKEPLIGATVMVKNTTFGTITDFDGKFIINVPNKNSVLQISYIGYESKEIPLNGRNAIIVTLTEEQTALQEVVVVGYGTQKKESVVGAISQVNNKALVDAGTNNITNAIAGKLSGVLTMQTSGKPGANDAQIIVRGVSSWNGSNPLVLVDGVERDFSDLDPNEVETISVLKDASATAVFGARGANGVIIVTTKEGRDGDPKFSAGASHGISWASRVPHVSDAEMTLNSYNKYLKKNMQFNEIVSQDEINKHVNPSSALESILYPNINWFDLNTHDFANVTTANASVRGGSDFVTYFSSLGFNQETSLFDAYQGDSKYHNCNYDYKRFNYRTNLNFKISKTTNILLKVGGDISITNSPEAEPWRDIFGASGVNYPAYYPAWMLQEYPDLNYPNASGDRLIASEKNTRFIKKRNNPYEELNNGSFSRNNAMKLFSDITLQQKLDFITKGLSFKGMFALSTTYAHNSLSSSYKRQKYLFYPENIGTDKNPWERFASSNEDQYFTETTPVLSVGGLTNYRYDIHYEASLNYNKTFGNNSITALALMNRDIKNVKTEYPYKNEAWVGRLTYDYLHKYLVEINMGYTGSERFAPSNRFGFFPSGAIGWVVSEEKFFKKALPWFSKLKFRYSDGLVGSDAADQRWLYMSEYTKETSITEDPGANFTAQWEQARKQDLGAEMGFFNNAFTVGIDLFKEDRDHMLLSPRYNPLVGNSFKELNLGSIKKHGYELELGYHKLTNYGLDYNIKGMLSFSENRIIEKDDLPYAPEYKKVAGKPFGGTSNGQILIDGGYMNNVDDVHIYPSNVSNTYLASTGQFKYLDYNGDGIIQLEDVFSIDGSSYAPYVFSLSGGFKYKNFEFSMLWSGNIGKYVTYDMTFVNEFGGGEVIMYENMENYWSPTNHNSDHSGMGCSGNMSFAGGDAQSGYNLRLPGHTWNRANYIKLKDLNLSYSIKSKSIEKMFGVDRLKVYLSGSNLLMLTELPMGDPESIIYSTGTYPQMSSIKLGVNIDF